MKKSFSSKLEELKRQVPKREDVERKLIPRLKFMGYTLFVLALASLTFAVFVKEESFTAASNDTLEAVSPLLIDDTELEPTATEVLNFYVVSFIFSLVGTSCFLIAWKKNKTLLPAEQPIQEE